MTKFQQHVSDLNSLHDNLSNGFPDGESYHAADLLDLVNGVSRVNGENAQDLAAARLALVNIRQHSYFKEHGIRGDVREALDDALGTIGRTLREVSHSVDGVKKHARR